MLRNAGVVVNDIALQHASGATDAHSIIIPDRDLSLKLQLQDTQSVLPIRRPTDDELKHLEQVELILPREWNPYDPFYDELERSAIARSNYVPNLGGNKMLSLEAINTGRAISATSSSFSPLNIHNHFQRHVSASSATMADVLPAYDFLSFGDKIIQQTNVLSIKTSHFPSPDAKHIANLFHVTPKVAEKTAASTHFRKIPRMGLKYGLTGRKLRTFHDSEQLKRLRVKVYADQMTAQVPTPSGDTGAMVFATDFQFTDVYPMFSVNNGEECGHALKEFIRNVGVPEILITDDNKSFTGRGTDWYSTSRDKSIKQANTEPYSHWHNKAEAAIREFKRLYKNISHGLPVPRKYWFYLLRYCSDIRNRTALNIYSLEGRTPYEKLFNEIPDIGPWIKFKYGEPVFFNFQKRRQPAAHFPK